MAAIRLTRRGRVLVAICVGAIVMAFLSGARSLNAVVLPGVVALVAAYLQLDGLDAPGVRRDLPPDDFAEATHEVTLRFSDPDQPGADLTDTFVAEVRDAVDDGLSGPDEPTRATVGAVPVSYDVTYEARGERTLGPATLAATDVFGLLERDLLCRGKESVLVYPNRYRVPAWVRQELYHDEALGASRQRDEFDRLREYARGDALRDVHWATTAKQDELVVKEFAAQTEQRRVAISGGARGGTADDLASAATSIALALLDDGVPVEVSVPNGRVATGPDPEGRRRLLGLLARTPEGAVPDPDADVVIDADHNRTTVRIDGQAVSFAELRDAATSAATEDGEVASSAAAVEADGGREVVADGGGDGEVVADGDGDVVDGGGDGDVVADGGAGGVATGGGRDASPARGGESS